MLTIVLQAIVAIDDYLNEYMYSNHCSFPHTIVSLPNFNLAVTGVIFVSFFIFNYLQTSGIENFQLTHQIKLWFMGIGGFNSYFNFLLCDKKVKLLRNRFGYQCARLRSIKV